jgi:hypothetical protein
MPFHARDMTGPNPSISGDAIRRALGPEHEAAANQRTTSDEQAELDVVELRALERAEYYGEAETVEPEPVPHRGWLARLFGGRSG